MSMHMHQEGVGDTQKKKEKRGAMLKYIEMVKKSPSAYRQFFKAWAYGRREWKILLVYFIVVIC